MKNGKINKLQQTLDSLAIKILVHTDTQKPLRVGDKIEVTEDCVIKGTIIDVQRIDRPSEEHPEGRIVYNISGMGWQQVIPRIVGCEWADAE